MSSLKESHYVGKIHFNFPTREMSLDGFLKKVEKRLLPSFKNGISLGKEVINEHFGKTDEVTERKFSASTRSWLNNSFITKICVGDIYSPSKSIHKDNFVNKLKEEDNALDFFSGFISEFLIDIVNLFYNKEHVVSIASIYVEENKDDNHGGTSILRIQLGYEWFSIKIDCLFCDLLDNMTNGGGVNCTRQPTFCEIDYR